MESIYNYSYANLENLLLENHFKKYNASQIFDWLYKKKVSSFNEMSNLSKSLIDFLNNTFCIDCIKLINRLSDNETVKYLCELSDKNHIECVLMKHNYGNSLCVSSQIGCNMGCMFCESGRLKKVRDLTTSEMLNQVISIEKHENVRIDNIVIMGIGEPFDNFVNVINFVKLLIDPKCLSIGQRKITISTSGIIPKIREFGELDTQVNLAISLHASCDEVRNKLMPINKAYPIKDLMVAVDEYIKKTNRRVTIEYILIDGINDTKEDALELCKLLKGKLVYVNLIPYNETSNFKFKRSKVFNINSFYDILKKNKIEVTVRREMASKLKGACGQLRSEKEEDLC